MRRAFFTRSNALHDRRGQVSQGGLSVDSEEPMAQATTDRPLGSMVAFSIVRSARRTSTTSTSFGLTPYGQKTETADKPVAKAALDSRAWRTVVRFGIVAISCTTETPSLHGPSGPSLRQVGLNSSRCLRAART